MRRFTWLVICALLGLAALVCGLLIPAHLRAVDSTVVEKANENTPGLVQRGLALVSETEIGAAQLFADAAQQLNLPGHAAIRVAAADLAKAHPELLPRGGQEAIGVSVTITDRVAPVTDWFARSEHRNAALDQLEHPFQGAQKDALHEIMQTRTLTNTVLFPPSQSSSGQAFDTAVTICGNLAEFGHLTKPLTEALARLASQANRGSNPQPFEQALLDFMSLGQRFGWGQLCVFVRQIQDTDTLRALAHLARQAQPEPATNTSAVTKSTTGNSLPLLFSEVVLSQNPAGVANYRMDFSHSGPSDLGFAMKAGTGGLNELLRRGQPMYISKVRPRLAVDLCWKKPSQALAVKWILFFSSGFLLAIGLHFAWPAVAPLERPLQVRGFHLARESLFALGFLTALLIFTEPFLAEQGQKMELSLGTRLASIVGPQSPGNLKTNVKVAFMETRNLIPIVLFFVLQALLYTACLVKLAEIRRQRVPARVKLRLLENEDHLFDAGLYLGFVGTIISLILFSLNIVQPSLMAAYSSTSFGIIGVSAFKIFHLRPVRRRILLESEAASSEPMVPATSRTLVTSS